MKTETCTLAVKIPNYVLSAFEAACLKNHIEPDQVISQFCQEYAKDYALPDDEKRLQEEISLHNHY